MPSGRTPASRECEADEDDGEGRGAHVVSVLGNAPADVVLAHILGPRVARAWARRCIRVHRAFGEMVVEVHTVGGASGRVRLAAPIVRRALGESLLALGLDNRHTAMVGPLRERVQELRRQNGQSRVEGARGRARGGACVPVAAGRERPQERIARHERCCKARPSNCSRR